VLAVTVADGARRPLSSKRWSFTGQTAWLADGSGVLVTASESANGPSQVWYVAIASGETKRVTHDLSNYSSLSLTDDSSKFVAVQHNSVSSIWVGRAGEDRPKQIASEVGRIREFAWTPEGRIVYRSNAGGNSEIWIMNADGSSAKQLTTGARAGRGLAVSPDGRHIFFSSDRAGRFNIWRIDADGSNATQLTNSDDEFYPHCAPDGQSVIFQRGLLEPRLWRVPVSGGESVELTKTRAMWPDVSPDGQMIAYYYLDPEVEKSRWRIGIVSAANGQPLQRFDFPPTVAPAGRIVRWMPDQQAIAFVNNSQGLSDIWIQPLSGSEPKPLTNFKAEQIIAFDWSRDGHSLAIVRGVETSDVVLIDHRQ
jgi:Tol biopolymer transport system component